MKARSRSGFRSHTASAALLLGSSIALFGAQGCLDRPVVPITPGVGGVIATRIRVTRIDKVDLLLMVDNSQSMGDKQSELGRRIPLLVKELTNPDDIKVKPVADLHVGVITSSLGSYGTSACDEANAHNNDHGHILPRDATLPASGWVQPKDSGDPSPAACPGGVAAASPLAWVYDTTKGSAPYVGPAQSAQMQTATSCVVETSGEDGCGYENQLESVYHFLIDPAPWQTAAVKCTFGAGGDACGTNKIEVVGTDTALLAQRKAFLRTDSLLAVLMITDENDASLKPAQLNWLPWAYAKGQMQRGWKACQNVPDDFEPDSAAEFDQLHNTYGCYSCFERADDPGGNCTLPWAKDPINNDVDGRNNREFNHVQRFGYNFFWGRQRYVDGFKNSVVPTVDAKGNLVGVTNPIYEGGFRTPELVVVAGIVGVPLPLVQNADGTPKLLDEAAWAKIVSPDPKVRDVHMIAQIAPRAGQPKYAGSITVDDPSKGGNGGDRDIADGDDLQYACIAKRAIDTKTDDCAGTNPEATNPLCAPGGKQPYFKAYPGLRPLRVLHDLGPQGFVASICNNTYAPAIQGIIEKLQAALNSQCFKSVLNKLPDNSVNCLIEETFAADTVSGKNHCEDIGVGYCTPGATPCRAAGTDYPPIDATAAAGQLNLPITVTDATTGAAKTQGCQAYVEGGNVYIGGDSNPLCGKTKHLVCEMLQLVGRGVDPATTNACLSDPNFSLGAGKGGWCYSTDDKVVGDACRKVGSPGSIRFEGDTQPKNGSEVFTLCVNGAAPAPVGSTSASISK